MIKKWILLVLPVLSMGFSMAQNFPTGIEVGTNTAGANIIQRAEASWDDVLKVYRGGVSPWSLQSLNTLSNSPNFTSNNLYVNQQAVLHAGNFNSYAPGLTGAGATGSWNINANSASYWGSIGANFANGTEGGNLAWLAGADGAAGNVRPYYAAAVKSFLGIPADGESLQTVVERGNTFLQPATEGGIIGIGRAMSPGNSAFIGWRYNNGAPYGYVDTYDGGAPFVLQPLGGNVGIGITAPADKLHVNGNALITGKLYWGWPNRAIQVLTQSDNSSQVMRFSNSMTLGEGNPMGGFDFTDNNGVSVLRIVNNNVNIGTTSAPADYKLAVEGTIGARKLKVTRETWADYVFDSSYQLQPLHQVEKFIQENKHLPEVPSAIEVKKEGLDVGDNQALLLKKIEELTLYIIQQNKDIQQLKGEVEKLKAAK